MAKLNKRLQEQTENAQSMDFEPLEPGVYHARLLKVDTDGSGPKGPYWTWEFEVVEEPYRGRKLWNNTSLSEKAAFSMKNTFEAFEVPLDTDTDDMCGSVVRCHVSIRTIQQGARAGELTNQVDRLSPRDPEFELDGDGGGSSSAGEDIFAEA